MIKFKLIENTNYNNKKLIESQIGPGTIRNRVMRLEELLKSMAQDQFITNCVMGSNYSSVFQSLNSKENRIKFGNNKSKVIHHLTGDHGIGKNIVTWVDLSDNTRISNLARSNFINRLNSNLEAHSVNISEIKSMYDDVMNIVTNDQTAKLLAKSSIEDFYNQYVNGEVAIMLIIEMKNTLVPGFNYTYADVFLSTYYGAYAKANTNILGQGYANTLIKTI